MSFLQAIAPPGSGRVARLVTAQEEARVDGSPVFSLEYVLTRADGRRIRNIAVVSFLFERPLSLKHFLLSRCCAYIPSSRLSVNGFNS
jgi:hypothetical protein